MMLPLRVGIKERSQKLITRVLVIRGVQFLLALTIVFLVVVGSLVHHLVAVAMGLVLLELRKVLLVIEYIQCQNLAQYLLVEIVKLVQRVLMIAIVIVGLVVEAMAVHLVLIKMNNIKGEKGYEIKFYSSY